MDMNEHRKGYRMSASVAVVGGGYGGIAVAKALDEIADVRLIEPRETFVHNVAALRAVADPAWIEQIFLPYDRLLTRGQVLRDRAVEARSGMVTLGSGERIEADYVVLATGSAYPFPAKLDVDTVAAASFKLRGVHHALQDAERVLLLGAGPVGLELAGEIKSAWPEKQVTIIEPADELIPGTYPAEFRSELNNQLAALGISVLLGTSLATEPPSAPGVAGAFTAATEAGESLTADIWFRCHGARPASEFLAGELAVARRHDGHVEVTDRLSLPGLPKVFAIGDLTAIQESKRAQAAAAHAQVVATNIRAQILGTSDFAAYQPAPDAIVLPLGPSGGVSYAPARGVIGADQTVQIKGSHLFVGIYRAELGLDEPTPPQTQTAATAAAR